MSDNLALSPTSDDLQSRVLATGLDLRIGDQVIGGYNAGIYTVGEFRLTRTNTLQIQLAGYGTLDIEDFLPRPDGTRQYYKLSGSLSDLEQQAIALLINPPQVQADTQTTALSIVSDNSKLDAAEQQLQTSKDRIDVLKLVAERKMNALRDAATRMGEQLGYIRRIIALIETFLGVYEEIVLLRDGILASQDEPITFRQLVLYMDEEVGDVIWRGDQQGIDFRSIEVFDQWVLKDRNLDHLLPEKKGVVALKVSRQERKYSADPLVQVSMNEENRKLYLLIRNGEKVWRIYTALRIGNTLFPSKVQFEKFLSELEQYERWGNHEVEARGKELDIKQSAVLLQGLIERTDVFKPTKIPNVNLFLPETFERGAACMLRDAEPSLSDGRPAYHDWKKGINGGIERGTRVLISRIPGMDGAWGDRKPYLYREAYYGTPAPGIYTVEEVVQVAEYGSRRSPYFKVLFTPNGNVWDSATFETRGHKRRISFLLHPRDEFILNYDALTLEDAEYWLANRLERRNYLDIIPAMREFVTARRAERQHEAALVTLLAQQMNVEEACVWEAVEWWKRKVISKRFIAEDDAKAWRMIQQRVKSGIHSNVEFTEGELS